MLEIIEHTLEDSLKLIPFLFLTYLAMEVLEHRAGVKTQQLVRKAGRLGPLFGAAAGILPQCGFSAAASNLYAGKVISMGTLIAIYLSTSDEMLPILISEQAPPGLILPVLLTKAVIGIAAGFLVDLLFRRKEDRHIHEMCEQERCHCEKGILRSAVSHTLQITVFILLITFGLNLILHNGGEQILGGILLNRPILGPVIAAIVGLIPNCAASVLLTQLYLEGILSIGSMMAGLLVGAGVGLLVLFKVNHDKKENLQIAGILYLVGIVAGIVIDCIVK